jgi:AraC-like DNA-binding protein
MLTNNQQLFNYYLGDDSVEDYPFRLVSAGASAANGISRIARTNYEFLTIELVTKGKGYLDTPNGQLECPTNSIYFLHKGLDHAYWSDLDDLWTKEFFICQGPLIDYLLKAYRMENVFIIEDCGELRDYMRQFALLEDGLDSHFKAAVIFHRFLQELYLKKYGKPKDSKTVKPVIELKRKLDAHIEEKADLEKICNGLGFSKAYMIRLFKQHTGDSPYDYLMNKRMESAKILLQHSTLSIKEIAERFCFSDQYYFSNYFKKHTGISPTGFREGISL